MEPHSSSQWDALLQSFCEAAGLPMQPGAEGIEFEADGYTVQIGLDPRSPNRLMADVGVAQQEDWPQGLSALLHHLNAAARLEHDWVATLSASGELRLHTQTNLSQTGIGELESLLTEGIERAEALSALAQALRAPETESNQADFNPHSTGMVRG